MKKKLLALGFAVLAGVSLAGCNDDSSSGSGTATGYLNEETPLIFSTQDLDGLLNPFFSTNAADSSVISLTQISMLGNDMNGNVTYGNDHATAVLDYELERDEVADTSTYKFVLKNNIKFSNGSALTMKDVLFNLYVYLDPVYSGSATMYSTDIVGLKEYRTQSSSGNEQDSFEEQFIQEANERISSLIYAADEIIKDHPLSTEDQFKTYLADYDGENLVSDYEKASSLFKEELESDYTNAIGTYDDITFKDNDGNTIENSFTTDVEAFLYNEGYLYYNKKDNKIESSLVSNPADLKTWTKDRAINTIISDKLPNDIAEILTYWATATNMQDYLINEAKDNYFQNTTLTYRNISGIRFANKNTSTTVNGKEYSAVSYGSDGSVSNNTNEVLTITINGVDPRAIYSFGFQVAPMYYYSNQEQINKFDFESNFGVEYGSTSFMNNVINSSDKVGLPVGAGPYQASTDRNTVATSGADFFNQNTVYYQRNDYFVLGAPAIKYIRYQVTAENAMINALVTNSIDFAQPNASPKNIDSLKQYINSGIETTPIETAGYGYIGINASKVPSIIVRQVIMHSIDTSLTVSYYGNTANSIYRSMSQSSWAYPRQSTAYYPFLGAPIPEDLSVVNPEYRDYINSLNLKTGQTLTESQQIAFVQQQLSNAGYTLNSNGVYTDGNNTLKYTFTIAGSTSDHPAWNALFTSSEFLNKCGFEINVSTDPNALIKLTTGSLTVWAAAWSSTIDPDMYQVYHKSSQATSVRNWGYPAILRDTNTYAIENALLNDLAELIEAGRATTNQGERKSIYSRALDIVMQLAIELPTYQRDDLFAYNTNKIDTNTFEKDVSSYTGLTDKIWNVKLNEYK